MLVFAGMISNYATHVVKRVLSQILLEKEIMLIMARRNLCNFWCLIEIILSGKT